MGKKEDKQFPLTNKKNCAVYLNRIISSCERCMDRLKKYNVETSKCNEFLLPIKESGVKIYLLSL